MGDSTAVGLFQSYAGDLCYVCVFVFDFVLFCFGKGAGKGEGDVCSKCSHLKDMGRVGEGLTAGGREGGRNADSKCFPVTDMERIV